ncbi:hypothetical protein ACMFMF_003902 [Clarireedia jacksonii]
MPNPAQPSIPSIVRSIRLSPSSPSQYHVSSQQAQENTQSQSKKKRIERKDLHGCLYLAAYHVNIVPSLFSLALSCPIPCTTALFCPALLLTKKYLCSPFSLPLCPRAVRVSA